MADVIQGQFGGNPFRHCGELYEALLALILERDGQVSLAEVIGVLQLLQRDIINRNEEISRGNDEPV